jgi:hypothetical protein
MQQRDFTTRLGGAAAVRRAARALQPRIWRVRVLAGLTADDQVARGAKIARGAPVVRLIWYP